MLSEKIFHQVEPFAGFVCLRFAIKTQYRSRSSLLQLNLESCVGALNF